MDLEFSPKQVAGALGVSESSLKRWCDRGLLTVRRTAGGHRKLLLADVLRFARDSGQRVVRPELISMQVRTQGSGPSIAATYERVLEALVEGHAAAAISLGLTLYTEGVPVAESCDQVWAPALGEIGLRWQRQELGVFQERRAVTIAMQFMAQLRVLLPEPGHDAPRALGAACEGDLYSVPVAMGELVLRDAGWNAQTLGNNIPISSICEAVQLERPSLIWLSFSHIEDIDALAAGMQRLMKISSEYGTRVVIGGRALNPEVRRLLAYTAYSEDFSHLRPLLSYPGNNVPGWV